MPAINDYKLKLGWDASAVNKGMTALEKRIENLAKKAQKINTTGQLKGTRSGPKLGGGAGGANLLTQLADRKTTMMDEQHNKMRSLQRTMANMDMGAKGAKEAKAELQGAINTLAGYQNKLKNTTFTSKEQLVAHRADWKKAKRTITDVQSDIIAGNKKLGFSTKVARRAMASFPSAAAAMIGGYALKQGLSALYSNGKAWENLNIQMQASFGSAEAGAKQMEYLKSLSVKLGVDVTALADGYAKIGVAGRMSNLPMEKSKEIFLAASEASRAFGLSTDDTQGVMRAFSQMMGKGQVMMEELKLQLGDRMPSAMGIFAKSMGKTVPEFMELVKAGKVGNEELVGFAKTLRADIRESGAYQKSLESVEAAQSRFNTSIKMAGDKFFQGAMQEGVAQMFGYFAGFMGETTEFWGLLGDALGWILKAGLRVLKVVLYPIKATMKAIGIAYQMIKDTSFVDQKDVDQLSTVARIVRFMTGFFVDIYRIVVWLGNNFASAFSFDTGTWDKLFNFIDKFIDINGKDDGWFGEDSAIGKAKKSLSNLQNRLTPSLPDSSSAERVNRLTEAGLQKPQTPLVVTQNNTFENADEASAKAAVDKINEELAKSLPAQAK